MMAPFISHFGQKLYKIKGEAQSDMKRLLTGGSNRVESAQRIPGAKKEEKKDGVRAKDRNWLVNSAKCSCPFRCLFHSTSQN